MANKAMMDAFKHKKPSKFADEGPPEDDPKENAFGPGDESGEAGDAPSMDGPDLKAPAGEGAVGGAYDEEAKAVDDMADILGVGPEDRANFGEALKAYVSACIAKTLSEPDGDEGGMPGAANVEGMPNGDYEGA